jgi:putative Mg2+ transporter-C (MgtC) family protein
VIGVLSAPPDALVQLTHLAVALGLTAAIGLERQLRDKSAGLRTHAVIGLGAALFVLVSKYGFYDVLAQQRVVLDPSRVAAQIASGIGFVGAGLIFVRRGDVKGLTSAAGVWLAAAIGAAAGAGLTTAAGLATGGYFVVAIGLRALDAFLNATMTVRARLEVGYDKGSGALSRAIEVCELHGFEGGQVEELDAPDGGGLRSLVHLRGRGSADTVVALIRDVPGVRAVRMDLG